MGGFRGDPRLDSVGASAESGTMAAALRGYEEVWSLSARVMWRWQTQSTYLPSRHLTLRQSQPR
jgi:hypothetical protein